MQLPDIIVENIEQEEETLVCIEIPIPDDIPRGYGLAATTGPNGCFIQFRGTQQEKAKIFAAAECLGILSSTFMRRVVNDAADAIIEYHKRQQQKLVNSNEQ